jgi:hypothetical protein
VLVKNKTIKNKKVKFNIQKKTLKFSFRTSKIKVTGVINKKSSKNTESAILFVKNCFACCSSKKDGILQQNSKKKKTAKSEINKTIFNEKILSIFKY